MPFCPKCRTEFENGYNTCGACGSVLVENLPSENLDLSEASFLASVGDEIQADLIESELKSNNIPVLKKYREAGAFLEVYMGMTSFGIDLYVPSTKLNEAKQILKNSENDISKDDDELLEENKKYIKRRAIRAWVILLFLTPVIILITFLICYIVNKLL